MPLTVPARAVEHASGVIGYNTAPAQSGAGQRRSKSGLKVVLRRHGSLLSVSAILPATGMGKCCGPSDSTGNAHDARSIASP
jgi:hypothetical protein